MLRKTTETQTIREQMLRKNPEKNYMRTGAPAKNQRIRYKHSVRRQVLQIKTVAGHCENIQYENKGLSKTNPTEIDEYLQYWFICIQ